MMKEFSDPRYGVNVMKVEVPVNRTYVEGYAAGDVIFTKEQAASYFKEQAEDTELPFPFLSAGVMAELSQETLRFANGAGSTFNGVLYERAAWAEGVESCVKKGKEAAVECIHRGKKYRGTKCCFKGGCIIGKDAI
ncbi:hypothetical protein NRIC_28290 [Enterococcus florum]|uniref:Uncharacterized protein n=1 Tax=Enterococcus florum TaxID=2480627 RepID=A0A4P5PFC0_9ENTE|nr:hypothetical protein NRIC_28290 [Enterococcus florum]